VLRAIETLLKVTVVDVTALNFLQSAIRGRKLPAWNAGCSASNPLKIDVSDTFAKIRENSGT